MLQQRMLPSPNSIAYQDAISVANASAHSIANVSTDSIAYAIANIGPRSGL